MKSTTAEQFKDQGNESFAQKNYQDAIEYYGQAIKLDCTNHLYYSNRSLAYLKHGDADMALLDAEMCLEISPTYIKGLSRKGQALHQLHEYAESWITYNEALRLYPDNDILKNQLSLLKKDISDNLDFEDLYKVFQEVNASCPKEEEGDREGDEKEISKAATTLSNESDNDPAENNVHDPVERINDEDESIDYHEDDISLS